MYLRNLRFDFSETFTKEILHASDLQFLTYAFFGKFCILTQWCAKVAFKTFVQIEILKERV